MTSSVGMGSASSRKDMPMTRRDVNDAANDTADSKDAGSDEKVVPEAGEGPLPPAAGDPRPPIGN